MRKNRNYELLKANYPKLSFVSSRSSEFLLPSVGLGSMSGIKIHRSYIPVEGAFNKLLEFGMVQVASYWEYRDYGDVLYVLFNPSYKVLTTHFHLMYDYLSKLNTFIDVVYARFGQIVIVLQIDKKWREAKVKNIVMEGRYSDLPRIYQGFFQPAGLTLFQMRVCSKDPVLRRELEMELDVIMDDSMELCSKPDKDLETLKIAPIEL